MEFISKKETGSNRNYKKRGKKLRAGKNAHSESESEDLSMERIQTKSKGATKAYSSRQKGGERHTRDATNTDS